ncbi:MAG: carboxylating nicotinate-nucleotide diphosphorylase [Dehalococcoidales bacterium]|nr:carboxylating nicotinate-nucleotide diphosphorylase [Dehalococcoidales bacterium]
MTKNNLAITENQLSTLIDLALNEDTGAGDVTSELLIPAKQKAKATLTAKADGVLAGIDIAKLIFIKVDPSLKFKTSIRDGAKLKPGDAIATVTGNARSILKAERTALNFLQKLSGIATRTASYVALVSDLKVDILDTRKTTPGMRLLEKYAVSMGGGLNHRFNLSDGILIKDNHLATLRAQGINLKEIVTIAKANAPKGIKIEVEVTNLKEVGEAVSASADIIMLDNMSPAQMRRAVKKIPAEIKTEASGGISLENVRKIAETGVNFISIGALTHSSKALDISLEFQPY